MKPANQRTNEFTTQMPTVVQAATFHKMNVALVLADTAIAMTAKPNGFPLL
jgi:hypothetical protein